MPCLLSVNGMIMDVLQLFFMLLVFVVVLFAACYTTKFLVKTGYIQGKTHNIELKESYRIAPGKNIQILKIGSKYIAVAESKEGLTFLAELSEEELDFTVDTPKTDVAFSDVFLGLLNKKRKED